MTNEEFFETLDVIGQAPDGVEALRRLILELAASARLTSEPGGVELHRLGDIVEFNRAGLVQSTEIEPNDWVLDLEDIEKDTGRVHNRVTCEERATTSSKARFCCGDVLYGKLRPYLNKVVVADSEGCCTTEIIVITPRERVSPSYLSILLRSPRFVDWANSVTHGVKMPRIGTRLLSEALLPVVPRAHQDRIVERVNELMALCDQFEAEQGRAEGLRLATAKSTFASIVELETVNRSDISRLLGEHFDVVLQPGREALSAVRLLRDAVLQLATRGRLTEQLSSDGHPRDLLDAIADLGKATGPSASKRRRQPSPSTHEASWEIPESWLWVGLSDVTISHDHRRIPLSREVRQTRQGAYDYYGASGVIDHVDDFIFDEPLLLIGEDGANLINRSSPIAFIARGRYWVNNHAHVLGSFDETVLRYLEIFINAIDLEPYVTGTAQPKLNQARMNAIPVALPPYAEQERIVRRVEELLGMCHELGQAFAEERETSSALAESFVASLRT